MVSLQITVGSIILFLLLSAFFSASETALFSIPRERFSYYQQAEQRSARWIYNLLQNAQRTLLMILLGNLFVNITLAGLIHSLIGFVIPGSSTLITMVVATVIIVIFGEMLPKNMALKHNESMAMLIAPILFGCCTVLSPVLSLIQSINSYFLDRIKIRLRRPSPFVTAEELKTGIITSRKRGAISDEEQDMIVGLLESGEEPVHKIMVHRSRLALLASDVSVEDALMFLKEQNNNVVYVFDKENTGLVLGVAGLADMLRANLTANIESLVKSMVWVLDTMEIAEVSGLLLAKKTTEAAVMDEHGSFCGVVRLTRGLQAMLSLKPQEVGTDTKVLGRTTRTCSGMTEISTLNGWLPAQLDVFRDDVRTLNGLLTTYLGRIPATGDKFAIGEYNFYIILASLSKIETVLIRRGKGYEC